MAALVQRIRARAASLPTFDIPFLLILLLLLSYGLIMLFSAGYAVALYRRGDAYTYIRPQLLFAALGVLAMYAASLVDYHVWHRLAWPMLGISLLLLAIVLFMPEYNGCKRWIVLPGLGTLQPSEIAKFSIVLVFSHIISLNHDRMKSFSTGVVPFALILGVVTVLMLLEPHLSGTLLILSIGAVLMFVGGTGLHWFGLAGGLGAAAIAAAVIALPELVPYATDRLASWRDPFADPLGEGHQTIQSLYAIASGGLAGLGLPVLGITVMIQAVFIVESALIVLVVDTAIHNCEPPIVGRGGMWYDVVSCSAAAVVFLPMVYSIRGNLKRSFKKRRKNLNIL